MLKRIAAPLAALLVVICALPALAADPTPAQVYQTARSGNLAEARQMIAQVLRDHPNSGRAHYVAAEIDARAGNLRLARQELQTAESLEPGLPFANPRSVQELQQQLGAAPATTSVLRPVRILGHSSHLGLFLILIGAAVVLWLVLRRRAAAMGYPRYPGQFGSGAYGNVPPGVPPGYGPGGAYGPGAYPGGYMPGGGSGIMGNVASGLALGAGVAAGEELVEHMMGGGSHPAGGGFVAPAQAEPMPDPDADPNADPNADMGGNDFGLNDPGSWDAGGGGGGWDDGGGDGGGWT
jgi:hypothetical protein